MNMPKRTLLALTLITTFSLTGCVINVGGHGDYHDGGDVTSVFGNVDIFEGRRAGDVSTVNGDVNLQNNVIADDVSTVNGNVNMGDNDTVQSASTVNGDIQAGKGLTVFGDVSTVNGNVDLRAMSTVEGDIETVNGDITLPDTKVNRDIATVSGSVFLSGNTEVKGDIIFKEAEDGWIKKKSEQPVLRIEQGVKVQGQIILERAVQLEIDDPAIASKVIRRGGTTSM